MMTEDEKYLFDLQGFLVVQQALDGDSVNALNAVIDDKLITQPVEPKDGTHWYLELLEWGGPYLDLIANPRITPYLYQLIGEQVRLDHEYAFVINPGAGPVGSLHGGAFPPDPCFTYSFSNGIIRNGLTVVAYTLVDVENGDGGFCCIPGSHKSNLKLPEGWEDLTKPNPALYHPELKKGDAVIFTEALTHGTLPWKRHEDRRVLFYKYSPPCLSWAVPRYNPDNYPCLSPEAIKMLEGPNARYPHRPLDRIYAR